MWQMALQAAQGFMSYQSDKAQYKYNKKIKEYRNKMTNIANAINQNAITQNVTLNIQQSAKRSVSIKRDEISALGSTTVAAAAAGVKGRSVNATLLDVQRKTGLLEKQRTDDLEQMFMQAHQQRLSSSLSAVQNQDLSYTPKPSLAKYMLNAASKVDWSSMSMPSFGGGPADSAGALTTSTVSQHGLYTQPARTTSWDSSSYSSGFVV